MANRFREKKVEEEPANAVPQPEETATPQQPETDTTVADDVDVPDGGADAILADKLVLKQIPLVLLCLVYLLLIIANRYHIESLSHEKQASEERINFLREQRIQLQKQYQQSVKISQIAEELQESGVGITAGPPYEIEK